MSQLKELLDRLWLDYVAINPQADQIHRLLEERGESIVNDHIAFRTFDVSRVNLDVLSRSFLDGGYEAKESYSFTEKKLNARHFEHPEAGFPKVFISELRTGEFSDELREVVDGLVAQIPIQMPESWDFPVCGRPWSVSFDTYEALARESEYAAWLAALGFRANHFTVFINELKTFDGIYAFNAFLKDSGFELNASGGEVKVSPDCYLEQSSTLAARVQVDFLDGAHTIPGCYYEFAKRYPLPDGELFGGFVAQSADKIFESTDRR